MRLGGEVVSVSSSEQLKSRTYYAFLLRLTIYPIFCSFPLIEPLRADFSGPLVSVPDGDTIEVLNGHHADRILLNGIDCPEKYQTGMIRN